MPTAACRFAEGVATPIPRELTHPQYYPDGIEIRVCFYFYLATFLISGPGSSADRGSRRQLNKIELVEDLASVGEEQDEDGVRQGQPQLTSFLIYTRKVEYFASFPSIAGLDLESEVSSTVLYVSINILSPRFCVYCIEQYPSTSQHLSGTPL